MSLAVLDVLTIGLPDCGTDDCKAVSCRKCTQCHEDDDPQVEGVDDMFASQANHLGELKVYWRQLSTVRGGGEALWLGVYLLAVDLDPQDIDQCLHSETQDLGLATPPFRRYFARGVVRFLSLRPHSDRWRSL